MRQAAVFLFMLMYTLSYSQPKFDIEATEKFQQELNAQFADEKSSPLLASDRGSFTGLDFFQPSADFFITAKFVRTENEKAFEMKTTTDRKPLYRKYGELHFSIAGKKLKLNVYQNIEHLKIEKYRNSLFLPFSDLTSGNETYIGGRYIDLEIPDGETIVIDFNRAYNPYCAYNSKYSCPAVPLENDLPVEIRAGVKTFHE